MDRAATQDWQGVGNGESSVETKRAARAGQDLPEDVKAQVPAGGQRAWRQGLVDLSVRAGRLQIAQTPAQAEAVRDLLEIAKWFGSRLFPSRRMKPRGE